MAATAEDADPPIVALQGNKGKRSLTFGSAWEGTTSLLTFVVLALACLAAFCSRLFAVIRFESIIHEFDPWYVRKQLYVHSKVDFQVPRDRILHM
jgi:dolichyl-diphosphooligosaccharide--protein glycosyltransferase